MFKRHAHCPCGAGSQYACFLVNEDEGQHRRRHFSKAKIRFQSLFILITTHPCFFASSYSACVNVPTFVSGSANAGPYAYSRFASSCSTSMVRRSPSPALVYSNICRSPVELPNAAYGRRPIIRWIPSGFPALLSFSKSFGSLVDRKSVV